MRLSPVIRGIGRAARAIFWLAFPIVPLLVEDAHYSLCTIEPLTSNRLGPDPYDWSPQVWWLMVGPLCGFGFLAGATWKIGDDAERRGWRSWKSRRSLWVGIGPWLGPGSLAAVVLVMSGVQWAVDRMGIVLPENPGLPEALKEGWPEMALSTTFIAWIGFAWLIVAWAALQHARRSGRLRGALWTGATLAIAFLGTLFGSYWLVTITWRDYYFDPTIVSEAGSDPDVDRMPARAPRLLQPALGRRDPPPVAVPRDAVGLGPGPGRHLAMVGPTESETTATLIRETRDMPSADAFPAVFDRLKEILRPYAAAMGKVKDEPGNYYLETRYCEKLKKPLMFAAVRVMKNYVSFHLMPVYGQPKLLAGLSPELKKRMQGKACFNFTSVDDALFSELAELTRRGVEGFRSAGMIG